MLNLFRLPFWGRNNNHENQLPGDHLTHGILRNFLARKGERFEERPSDEAQRCVESEFKSLHESLRETPAQDQYERILASLRRIDDQLDSL